MAAALGFLANCYFARLKTLEEERSRTRDLCAKSQQAVFEYKELPYAIRRRDAARPGEERVRLSEAFRAIQRDLSYYEAWTIAEGQQLGEAYGALLHQLRKSAGGACREAWQAEPAQTDAEMNIDPAVVDLSAVTDAEIAYEEAVRRQLARYQGFKALFVGPKI